MPTVQVEGLGNVSFPDGTPEADMTKAVQEALTQKNAPAPLSGPIGEAPPDPITTPANLNKASLWEGLKGAGKGLVGSIASANPAMTKGFGPGGDIVNTDASNPDQMAGKIGEGAAEMAVPGMMAKEVLPSTARAGKLFESIAGDAANQPVSLTRAQPILEKMLTLGKEGGGAVPGPVRQLANAGGAGTPKSVPLLRAMQNELNGTAAAAPQPLLYPSGRNFQSGLSSLSREDIGNMGGPMAGQLKQLNKAFYGDMSDAATAAGRGEDYAKAMREFRQGSQLKSAVKGIVKYAIPAAAGGGAIGYGLKKVMQ